MKVANLTDILQERFGMAKAVRMNAEAGFEAVDVTMYTPEAPLLSGDAKSEIREMKAIADAYGIVFHQSHTPFPCFRFGKENEEYNRKLDDAMRRSLEISAEFGVSHAIVHPIFVPGADEQGKIDFNLELLAPYVEIAEKSGIGIAIENMWGRHPDAPDRIVPNVCSLGDELRRMVEAFRTPTVTACLDIGHCGLVGDRADRAVLALGKTLTCLHVHDNGFFTDDHTAPFVGKMNYSALTAALREVGYAGDMTFEAGGFYVRLPDDLLPAALTYLCAVGKHLRSEFFGEL